MAEAGADPAAEALARYYDLDLEDDPGDLDLYLALAERADGPVLELAAGSGRLAVPLAAAGHAVTALDLDRAALARAAERWSAALAAETVEPGGSLELVEADLLAADLGPRFGLVLLALNSLFLLGTAERQAAAFRALVRHLAPEGTAVVDAWLPDAEDLARYDGRLLLEWQRDDPLSGEHVAKSASALHDAATATVELTTFFDAWPAGGGPLRRVARRDRLRLAGAAEMGAMAEQAGLAIERLAGGYDLAPFGPGSARLVLVGRRPGGGLV